jgi:hypothetical protein
MINDKLRWILEKVGRGGVEPPRPCGQEILSLRRLPFRHRPVFRNDDVTMLQPVRQYIFWLILTNLSYVHIFGLSHTSSESRWCLICRSLRFLSQDFYRFSDTRIGQTCISAICVS